MLRSVIFAFAVVFSTCLSFTTAAEPAPPGEFSPLLTQSTQVLIQDPLDLAPEKPWYVAAPEWTAVDGAWRATHRMPIRDHHGPVIYIPLDAKNLVVRVKIKLEGKARAVVHIDKAKGHLCRTILAPDALYLVRRDSSGDKGTRLDEQTMTIEPGVWHTLVFEASGRELATTLDGKVTLFGERDDLDVPKTRLILESAGGTAWFQDLRVWEAKPNPAWPLIKEQLIREREKK